MKKLSEIKNLHLQAGDIVFHSPGGDHRSFGGGTLIKRESTQSWMVQFFDGRQFKMINWVLKKITQPLTNSGHSGKM